MPSQPVRSPLGNCDRYGPRSQHAARQSVAHQLSEFRSAASADRRDVGRRRLVQLGGRPAPYRDCSARRPMRKHFIAQETVRGDDAVPAIMRRGAVGGTRPGQGRAGAGARTRGAIGTARNGPPIIAQGLARHFYGPSVLRRRHSGRLSHRSWLALPVLVMVWGCAWGRGKPLPFGAARGQSWATSSTIFCCSPVWHYSSRGLSSRPRACSSDAAPLLSDAPRAVCAST